MSEFKGTKGAWEVFKHHQVISFSKTVADCENDTMLPNEQQANAQLISCAPEMLEALKVGRQAVMELMNHEEGWEDEYTYIDNLITKATTI